MNILWGTGPIVVAYLMLRDWWHHRWLTESAQRP